MQRRILVTGGSGFIGSNFVDEVARRGEDVLLNLDLVPPRDGLHLDIFRSVDILQGEAVKQAFEEFRPSHVVHFAGKTDMFGEDVKAYAANHEGTHNVIAAVQAVDSIERVVFTSSQFVVGPGALPASDIEFRPHTLYGQSKVLSELAVREAELSCMWTIIRPTNIWGAKHPRYPSEFWRVLKQGRYVHPGGHKVIRCYGYVGNVVEQVLRILASERGKVDHKVFYVGDSPVDLLDWANAFSIELTGKPVRVVPRFAIRGLALVGDAVVACGGRFPIFSSRFRSMTEDYLTPMTPTFDALGPSSVSMEQGVRETVQWLRGESEFWQ
jgi:nucleoside-diphosphate-sugar epimerase